MLPAWGNWGRDRKTSSSNWSNHSTMWSAGHASSAQVSTFSTTWQYFLYGVDEESQPRVHAVVVVRSKISMPVKANTGSPIGRYSNTGTVTPLTSNGWLKQGFCFHQYAVALPLLLC
jgi:hypothetical protein